MSAPVFDLASGALRFWVLQPDETLMGASISKETLHYCFKGDRNGDNAVGTYTANQKRIDDAVRRRVANGSIEPVLLRERDLT